MKTSDKFSIYCRPLLFNPILAKETSLNQAIFIRQLGYWIGNDKSGKIFNGRKWIRDTTKEWQKQFMFWSIDTIKRTINKMVKNNLILSRTDLNKHGYDRTKWYTINFDKLDKIFDNSKYTPDIGNEDYDDKKNADCNNATMQNATMQQCKMHHTIPKSSSKISSKGNSSKEQDTLVKEAEGVIRLLNVKANRHFKFTKDNLGMIKARIREGYSNKDFAYVIMYRIKTWDNPKMRQYIRPKTLFTEQHMNDYLDEALVNQKSHQGRNNSTQNSPYKSEKELKKEDKEQRAYVRKIIKQEGE